MKAKLYDGKTFFLSCWEINMELTHFLEAKNKFELQYFLARAEWYVLHIVWMSSTVFFNNILFLWLMALWYSISNLTCIYAVILFRNYFRERFKRVYVLVLKLILPNGKMSINTLLSRVNSFIANPNKRMKISVYDLSRDIANIT